MFILEKTQVIGINIKCVRPRRVEDQADYRDMDALIRDSRFNVLAHEAGSVSNSLFDWLTKTWTQWQPTCNEWGWDARSSLVWYGGRNERLRKKRILEWSYNGQSVNTATQLHLLKRTRHSPFTNTLPKALERRALYLWKTLWLFSFRDQVSPKRMLLLGQTFWFPWGWRNTEVAEAKQQYFFFKWSSF